MICLVKLIRVKAMTITSTSHDQISIHSFEKFPNEETQLHPPDDPIPHAIDLQKKWKELDFSVLSEWSFEKTYISDVQKVYCLWAEYDLSRLYYKDIFNKKEFLEFMKIIKNQSSSLFSTSIDEKNLPNDFVKSIDCIKRLSISLFNFLDLSDTEPLEKDSYNLSNEEKKILSFLSVSSTVFDNLEEISMSSIPRSAGLALNNSNESLDSSDELFINDKKYDCCFILWTKMRSLLPLVVVSFFVITNLSMAYLCTAFEI